MTSPLTSVVSRASTRHDTFQESTDTQISDLTSVGLDLQRGSHPGWNSRDSHDPASVAWERNPHRLHRFFGHIKDMSQVRTCWTGRYTDFQVQEVRTLDRPHREDCSRESHSPPQEISVRPPFRESSLGWGTREIQTGEQYSSMGPSTDKEESGARGASQA